MVLVIIIIFILNQSACSLIVGSTPKKIDGDVYDVNDEGFEDDAEGENSTCESYCLALPQVSAGHCEGGICIIDGCDSGWGDCNSNPNDGCEQDLTGVNDCGGCGNNCAALANVEIARCESGECVIESCNDGFWNINGDSTDGCEYFCNMDELGRLYGEVCGDGIDNECDSRPDGGCVVFDDFEDGNVEGWTFRFDTVSVSISSGIVKDGLFSMEVDNRGDHDPSYSYGSIFYTVMGNWNSFKHLSFWIMASQIITIEVKIGDVVVGSSQKDAGWGYYEVNSGWNFIDVDLDHPAKSRAL